MAVTGRGAELRGPQGTLFGKNSAEQMAAQVKSETEKFAKLVKEAKVTID